MPVDDKHPDYDKMLPLWAKCRDCAEGEEAVKARNEGKTYLPMLSGQVMDGGQGQVDYRAYRDRAMFYGASGRTVAAMTGAIFRKDPDLAWPESKADLLEHVSSTGDSFRETGALAFDELLTVGRFGLLVDAAPNMMAQTGADSSPEPFVSVYFAENIINWDHAVVDGRKVSAMVVLTELIDVPDENDPFKRKKQERIRVLRLGVPLPPLDDSSIDKNASFEDRLALLGLMVSDFEDGPIYFQDVWIRNEGNLSSSQAWEHFDTIVPRMNGGRLMREIPFVVVNPTRTGLEPEKPPILALANVNLSHYRNSADLEHGRHWCALPTAVAAGFDSKKQWRVGSMVAWATDIPTAKAYYLEFTGAGLGHIQKGMDSKERLMAILGARMLEETKKAQEAAETVRLRQSGEMSVLSRLSMSASEGFTKTMRRLLAWLSPTAGDGSKASVAFNRDFAVDGMDPAALVAMMQQVQSGVMSWSTYFFNVKRAEMIPDDVTEEDEAAKIAAGPPAPDEPEEEEEEEGAETRETGETNGHTHEYSEGASKTSSVDGHAHDVEWDGDEATILEAEGHAHAG